MFDRRVVPAVSTVKTPWGQRLAPVAELERFVQEHLEPAPGRAHGRPAGRPPTGSRPHTAVAGGGRRPSGQFSYELRTDRSDPQRTPARASGRAISLTRPLAK